MKRLAAAVSICALITGCAGNDGPTTDPVAPNPPIPSATPVELPENNKLFFLAGTNLYLTDTRKESTKVLEDLGTTDVAIAPDGKRFAYSLGGEDPKLYVGEIGGKAKVEIKGRSPSFSPDGRYLAAVVPDPNYRICDANAEGGGGPQGCSSGERVLVYDAHALQKKPDVAIGAGLWEVVGWSEGAVAAYNLEEAVLTVGEPGPSGEAQDYLLSDLRAVSVYPERLRVLAVQGQILQTGDPGPGLNPVGLSGHVTSTSWSSAEPKALIAVDQGAGPTLQLLDADTGQVTQVVGSEKLVGAPVWSLDGETFAFVSGKGRSFRADVCTIQLTCGKLFESDGEIQLLYLDN